MKKIFMILALTMAMVTTCPQQARADKVIQWYYGGHTYWKGIYVTIIGMSFDTGRFVVQYYQYATMNVLYSLTTFGDGSNMTISWTKIIGSYDGGTINLAGGDQPNLDIKDDEGSDEEGGCNP